MLSSVNRCDLCSFALKAFVLHHALCGYLLADLDATKLSDLENEVKRGYNLLGHTYNRPQTSTGFRRETANVVPSRPSTAFVR